MKFAFYERKTAQVAVYLLSKHGGKMKYMHLLKLMYLAERTSFIERGRPVTGDKCVSMRRGPVLSKTYSLIMEEPGTEKSDWHKYIGAPSNYDVESKASEEDFEELSPYEKSLLDRIYDTYGKMDRFALADLTHTICPEWQDPGDSSIPILPEDILRAAGKSPEEIAEIRQESEGLAFIASLEMLECDSPRASRVGPR